MSQPNTDKMNSLKPVSLPLSKIMKKQSYTEKEFKILQTYQNFNEKNKHKMVSIPIFDLKENEII